MRFDILTLFPEMFTSLKSSILARGQDKGLFEVNIHNIRDYSKDKHRRVDDSPYGGGFGMVMTPQPIYDAVLAVSKMLSEKPYVIHMSPGGRVFDQQRARELLEKENICVLCGHYEGIDERVLEQVVDEEISLGDFVLTGGEIPAMAVVDAVARMIPGVLPDEEAFSNESHFEGLLEHPQYTRPAVWMEKEVPEVLQNGHHEKIGKWKRQMSLYNTLLKRPDLFEKAEISEKEKNEILELVKEKK